MFYEDNHDNALRFGDVVNGYVLSNSHIEKPFSTSNNFKYNINIEMPSLSVILTPCCSIEENNIVLSPLIELRSSFFSNPYFIEDLTNINRRMPPEKTLPPEVWENLPGMEKQKRLLEGETYSVPNLFVYESNALFPKYTINRKGKNNNIETNVHMIDFKNIYKVDCDKIITPQNSPLYSKCLQLSIKTRSELRDKLSSFYRRVPKEDLCDL
ncbi:MAG: hypothetical protein RBR63_03035 [Methanosarcina vacuolata]|jgi:hypothetical protein|nr:hypothetical protein [Methanosarcina vacuolata]